MSHLVFPDSVHQIVRILNKAGFEAYPVGGAVRDLLMGKNAFDYDIATNAVPEKIESLFEKTIPTGIKHGTVSVIIDAVAYEVTTYRVDGIYEDGRHPSSVVFSASLEEDLKRRDFTMNALAYDLKKSEIIDLFGGLEDINKKIIRCIGNPNERFLEDALRMLRAIRFSAQLGFCIEEETFLSIERNCEKIDLVSKERVKDEIVKMFSSKKKKDILLAIENMRQSRLMGKIFPEVSEMVGVGQNSFHSYDVYRHSLETLRFLESDDYRLRLAAFFHDIGKPLCKKQIDGKEEAVFYDHENVGAKIAEKILRRLKFSNEDIDFITHFIRCHMLHYTPHWSDGALRRFIKKVGLENIDRWFLLRYADRLGTGMKEKSDEELDEFRRRLDGILKEKAILEIKDLSVNGYDIMEILEISPSKELGEILSHLLDKVIDEPKLNEKETLLRLAKEYFRKEAS